MTHSSPEAESLKPADFAAWREIIAGWTGSAFLAGEKMPVRQQRQHLLDLYRDLCSLTNHLQAWEQSASTLTHQEAEGDAPKGEAEPVAWRVKDFADGWILCHSEAQARREAEGAGNLVEPLFALSAPPAPDAPKGEAHGSLRFMAERAFSLLETLRQIEDMEPVTQEMTTAHQMAELAREAIHAVAEVRALSAPPAPVVDGEMERDLSMLLTIIAKHVKLDDLRPGERAVYERLQAQHLAELREWFERKASLEGDLEVGAGSTFLSSEASDNG